VTNQNLTMRPICGREELELFCSLPYVLNDEIADDLDAGRRRPEWMWLALDDDRVLARAAWWGRADDTAPSILDILDVEEQDRDVEFDRAALMTSLLLAATAVVLPAGASQPDYSRFVRADWRQHEATALGVRDRMEALEKTGARLLVERLRFVWHPGVAIAPPSGRLAFRPLRDAEELLTLMTLALEGTLDVHSQQDLTQMSARDAAVSHYEGELAQYKSPREWWRTATLADGEAVGFVTPARNDYNAIMAYLAVLPGHRGNGYVDEILAEGTRVLAAEGVPRIRASTDLDNLPMARAFGRAGWVNFERTINMTWQPPVES
jgi:RimJ/RimL family protein N-acetyltransferase